MCVLLFLFVCLLVCFFLFCFWGVVLFLGLFLSFVVGLLFFLVFVFLFQGGNGFGHLMFVSVVAEQVQVFKLSPVAGEKDYFYHMDEQEGLTDLYDLKHTKT